MSVDLNENQRKAAYYDGDKYLVIEAGPGAGKTHVLIERIKFLVNEKKVDPSTLLVITFTRKAADELQERLLESLEETDVYQMQISTIHSFCRVLLSDIGEYNIKILSDSVNEKLKMFLSKHLEDLGFVNEYSILPSGIFDMINKYNEYATFGVRTDELVEYINKNKPISQDYIDFVNDYMAEHDGAFPIKEIKANQKLKNSWYNARYIQIARSYPIYLDLLEKENFSDFAQMQIKALEYLRKNPKTTFTNILIDEFQDTDPVQMKIFEILMKNADSFTVVGDIDQSIYGFRGANKNYFEYLYDNYDNKVFKVNLNVNYRSSNQIIKLSEDYIKPQRSKNAKVDEAVGARDLDRNCYFLVNKTYQEEAEELFELIKYLLDNEIVESYNEIAILGRTVRYNKTIEQLVPLLNENNIPYFIKGISDLFDKDEIRSVLTLLNHLVQDNDPHNYKFNTWELEWLNLKAYTGENFNQKLFNLSDDTKDILNKVEEDFQQKVLKTEKQVFLQLRGKSSKKERFARIFERDEDILIEIFKRLERPYLTDENLKKYGVTNKEDLDFFKKLNSLRRKLKSEEFLEGNESILDIYMDLLSNVCNYLTEEFVNDECNREELENLAILSNTLHNYELIVNNKNLKGAFDYLYYNIKGYSTNNEESNAVQIMTVHGSKGLEFPVVILLSLDDKKFPSEYKDPNPPSGYILGRPTFFTPNDFLEYKNFENEAEEIKEFEEEEDRIVYVAMTRAQDVLILSNLVNDNDLEEHLDKLLDKDLSSIEKNEILADIPKANEKINDVINKNIGDCRLLDVENINISKTHCKKPLIKDEDPLILNFYSLEDYVDCPFKYKLMHEIKFKKSVSDFKIKGLLAHRIFEVVNKEILKNNNQPISDKEIKSIVNSISKSADFSSLEQSEKYSNDIIDNVLFYYNSFAHEIDVLEVEKYFRIKERFYELSGVIDLVYKTKDGRIGILDYKNTRFTDFSYVKKYIKQVYTYLIALREQTDLKIDELRVYAIKSREMIVIDLNENAVDVLKKEFEEISNGIEKSRFECNPSMDCETCSFSNICNISSTNDDKYRVFDDNSSIILKNRFYDDVPNYKIIKLDDLN